MPTSLVWFRSDLRTADHTPLALAAAAGDPVVATFLLAPGQWGEHDWAACKVDFLLRNLRCLSESLVRLGIPLIVLEAPRFADAPAALLELARRHDCRALYFNNEYELNESGRDGAVEAAFRADGRGVDRSDDQVLTAPGSIRTGEGRPYTVFTPFKRVVLAALEATPPVARGVPAAGRVCQPGGESPARPSPIPASLASFESRIDPELWPAGETAALARLESFCRGPIRNYKSDRNTPALDGTSALSPYLTLGVVSPRQCYLAARAAAESKPPAARAGHETWISELIWRDFYKHLIAAYPRLSMARAFKPATDSIPWRHDQPDFAAWREGRTGVPIVDAAMRQLNATGWMHNRLRMIAAMFLTKDLFIDWRWGERYFMQRLIDGDLASNNGGWQWSASTGTDAAPYFRIFNPWSQSRACDGEGNFIRRWLPELAALDNDAIHEPQTLPPLERAKLEYPDPIVDHGAARVRVMDAFRALSPG